MTNQRTERSRPGSAPGRRGSGVGGGAWLSLWAFALLLAAGIPARAAEVVEVRIGRHPEFTRVVFELDRAAGYRIERSAPSAQASELIVSLEAASIPRRIQSTKSFIEQVVVEPSGTRSVARIRLARDGLKLKEMILASPPRIVLDVIAEPGVAAREATKAAPATAAKAVAPTPPTTAAAVKPAATVAKAEAGARTPATTAKPTPSPTPAPTAPKTALAESGGAPATTKPATPAPESKLLASTEKPGAAATTANTKAGTPSAPTPNGSDSAAAGESLAATTETKNAAAPSEWNDGGRAGAADRAAAAGQPGASGAARPTATAANEKPSARPMMVKSTEKDEGGGLLTWALAGLALALAAFGGLVVARRRAAAAAAEGADEGEAASPFGGGDTFSLGERGDEEDAEAEERSPASPSTNPFAGLSGAESPKPAPPREIPKAPRAADKAEKKPSESLLFDDTEEKTMEGMEVISRSQAGESLGGAMPMMGGASDELQQMFREMQRRVAALESRIDELVDARDRLERQVAAQTEELRVQRAAIARTQRAVRNLARPEEAGDDEPTEPALRDPS